MKSVITKIPNEDYEKLREACGRRGMTLYECLKFLVYKFLKENGYTVSNPPLELRLAELERQIEELRKAVATLTNRVSELEQQRRAGAMDRFMKRR